MRPPSSGNAGIRLKHEQARRWRDAVKANDDLEQRAGGGVEARAASTKRVAEQREADDAEDDDDQQQRHRPGRPTATRNSSPGVSRVAVGAHEAAEEEQVDAADPDPLAARGEARARARAARSSRRTANAAIDRGDEALAGVDDRVARTSPASHKMNRNRIRNHDGCTPTRNPKIVPAGRAAEHWRGGMPAPAA